MNKLNKYFLLAGCLTFIMSCSKDDDEETSTPTTPSDCFEQQSYTDQLPNMDFETWGYPDSSENKYLEPCGGVWTSSNAISSQLDVRTSLRTTDAQSGKYAVMIKTEGVFGGLVLAPGIFFSGKFLSYELDLEKLLSNAEFGVPFTEKPKSLKGFHKYISVNGDSAYVAIMLSKYNTSNKTKDTVGFGELIIYNSISNYTQFDIGVDYSYSAGTEIPDSVAIIFTPSKGIEDLVGGIGSTLFVDNCSFGY